MRIGKKKKKKISRPFLYYRARLRLVLLFLVIDGGEKKKRKKREREKRIEGKIKGDKSGGKKEEKYSRPSRLRTSRENSATTQRRYRIKRTLTQPFPISHGWPNKSLSPHSSLPPLHTHLMRMHVPNCFRSHFYQFIDKKNRIDPNYPPKTHRT